jgi:hypothetical protein
MQRFRASSWAQRTPAGLPKGMPGIGEEIEGAMQQAPQPGRQSIDLQGKMTMDLVAQRRKSRKSSYKISGARLMLGFSVRPHNASHRNTSFKQAQQQATSKTNATP